MGEVPALGEHHAEAPPIAEFQQVFRHVGASQSLGQGVEGVGNRERVIQTSCAGHFVSLGGRGTPSLSYMELTAFGLATTKLLSTPLTFTNLLTVRAGNVGHDATMTKGAANIVLVTNHVLIKRFLTAGLNKPESGADAQRRSLLNTSLIMGLHPDGAQLTENGATSL